MKTTIVLIGPHGAGKTTIGKMLSNFFKCPFGYEIGKELRQQILENNPKCHAMIEQEEFDKKVLFLEKIRDLNCNCNRIVETWHPGNCAFASIRSPKIMNYIYKEVYNHLNKYDSNIIIQPLEIDKKTILNRLSEIGPNNDELSRFFLKVYKKTVYIAKKLKIKILEPVNTKELTINDTFNCVINNLSSFHIR